MSSHFNKSLKILFGIEFILILVVIVLALIDNKSTPTAFVVKEIQDTEKNDFKISTKAVCENISDHIFCHDELFVSCNGEEYIITNDNLENFTCNDIKLNLSDAKINGSTVFRKEWADPRK